MYTCFRVCCNEDIIFVKAKSLQLVDLLGRKHVPGEGDTLVPVLIVHLEMTAACNL